LCVCVHVRVNCVLRAVCAIVHDELRGA
jgi:hypothetical protein